MKSITTLILSLLLTSISLALPSQTIKNQELLKNAQTIIFLGDSITYSGQYVVNFDTWLTLTQPNKKYTLINLGLSSETISGLSEKNHARGKFPRPDLHERLDRILTKTKPDLIFACYGMNCGIYLPSDPTRTKAFQKGITKLKKKAEATGAKIIFITPPFFDSSRNKNKHYYTDLLSHYSKWLVTQRQKGWNVIDLNTHMTKSIQLKRKTNPKFTYQKDAVHPNPEGHWNMTQPILAWFGDQASANAKSPKEMLTQLGSTTEIHQLISLRSRVLRDAWLTETKHNRPGVTKGLPINQATQKAQELTNKIKTSR